MFFSSTPEIYWIWFFGIGPDPVSSHFHFFFCSGEGGKGQKYPQYCWEFHDRLWEALSGTTSEKRSVPSRTGGENAGNALEPSNALNYRAWGIPAVLSRGIPGNALSAFPGSFRNFSGVSSGKSQPHWGCGPKGPCPIWLDDRGTGQWKWMEEVPRCTSLAPLAFPCFLHCLIGVETEGLLGYQGDHFPIVRWNLRPVIFGVEREEAQWIAERAVGKGPRQKTSKSAKKFFATFRHFSRRAKTSKNRQKTSTSFFFDAFWHFSRRAPFFWPSFWGALRGVRGGGQGDVGGDEGGGGAAKYSFRGRNSQGKTKGQQLKGKIVS